MSDKFLKVSRGFVNTVIYFRVREDEMTEVSKHFEHFEDENPGCHTEWVSGQGLGDRPVLWEDRAYVGF